MMLHWCKCLRCPPSCRTLGGWSDAVFIRPKHSMQESRSVVTRTRNELRTSSSDAASTTCSGSSSFNSSSSCYSSSSVEMPDAVPPRRSARRVVRPPAVDPNTVGRAARRGVRRRRKRKRNGDTPMKKRILKTRTMDLPRMTPNVLFNGLLMPIGIRHNAWGSPERVPPTTNASEKRPEVLLIRSFIGLNVNP